MSTCLFAGVWMWLDHCEMHEMLYWSMNLWCWASSFLSLTFLFMTSTLHGLLFDWAAYTQAHTHVNLKTFVPSHSRQPRKSTASMSYGNKRKPHHAWMSSKSFAFQSSVMFFSLFSCTLFLTLALESGKKRVVPVVVTVGNISCELCTPPCSLNYYFTPHL